MFGHQVKSEFRIEFAGAIGQNRNAVVPAGKKHIDQAADPGPIGRCPEQIARLREKVVRKFHAGQVAEQGSVGMQGTFGRTGGSGGVDDQSRVVRSRGEQA